MDPGQSAAPPRRRPAPPKVPPRTPPRRDLHQRNASLTDLYQHTKTELPASPPPETVIEQTPITVYDHVEVPQHEHEEREERVISPKRRPAPTSSREPAQNQPRITPMSGVYKSMPRPIGKSLPVKPGIPTVGGVPKPLPPVPRAQRPTSVAAGRTYSQPTSPSSPQFCKENASSNLTVHQQLAEINSNLLNSNSNKNNNKGSDDTSDTDTGVTKPVSHILHLLMDGMEISEKNRNMIEEAVYKANSSSSTSEPMSLLQLEKQLRQVYSIICSMLERNEEENW